MATNWDEYKEFYSDAEKDDRVGDHSATVMSVVHDTWNDGDPRIKVVVKLNTARGAKADFTLGKLYSPAELKEMAPLWDGMKRKAVAGTMRLMQGLEQQYGLTPDTISEGDEFNVKTAKNKEGFIRVIAILPKGDIKAGGSKAAAAAADVPF